MLSNKCKNTWFFGKIEIQDKSSYFFPSDIRGYEEKKLSQPNPLRLTVRKHLKTLLSTRYSWKLELNFFTDPKLYYFPETENHLK